MQAVEVKGQGVRTVGRSGEWLRPALLAVATVLVLVALLASGALSQGSSSGRHSTATSEPRPSGQTQQPLRGNLAGDDVNAGTPDHSQPTEGFIP